ncbi:MAG TPA: NAD(P)-dependent oxidoreductase [Thermomicrobiaceae bacterium]|nr:NAD(P)-dependent oxidoreductase [Thermomicrobiaceae bacterium]
MDEANPASECETVVAGRRYLALLPDATLVHARLLVLLDPTLPERLRAERLLAGRQATRLLVLPTLDTMVAAEHTLLLLLATVRGLLPAYSELVTGTRLPGVSSRLTDREVSARNWVGMVEPGWLWGKTLGILGLGRVGHAVATRAAAFGMQVRYHDLLPRPDLELRHGFAWGRLDQVLREADVVSLHLPLTPDTIRIIDAPELALMRPDAVLVNTAHGRLIDEGSLIQALRLGEIGGAGLDVFAYEPIAADSPLHGFDNVVLTPHVGGVPPDVGRANLADRLRAVLLRHGKAA